MGRGLIRLYLALWSLWFCFGVATNYKELATYLGSDRWTMEKAAERQKERWKIECDGKSFSDECQLMQLSVPSNEVVTENQVELTVWMFKMAILKAPFYFFVLMVVLYWLMKWVVTGFRQK